MASITAPRPTRSRRPLGMSLATAMIVTLAPVAGFTLAPAGATTSTPSASWGDCPADVAVTNSAGVAAKCTTITVPMDYANPAAGTFNILATGFFPAGTPKGVILGNPGGPGGSALDFWGKGTGTPAEMYRDYALVGLQPRGLKNATSLTCTTAPECIQQADAAYQKTLTAENIARDMDELRKAMGVDKISYYGASWGTELGAVYATLFPQRVDKMVLDSNVNPVSQVGAGNFATAASYVTFERRLYDFFDWAAANNQVIGLGDTPYKVYSAWNTARLIEDPKSWVYNYTPPALREADLPENLRPIAGTLLPKLDSVIQTMSRREYAERLAAAARTKEIANVGAAVSEPTSPIMLNSITAMYSRSAWSPYAGQIDAVLRPIDLKQVSKLVDISTLDPGTVALIKGIGGTSSKIGSVNGTDLAAILESIQGSAVSTNAGVRAREGNPVFTADPRILQLKEIAEKDLDRAIAAGESSLSLRARAAIIQGLTEVSWGGKPASWSGAGLATAPLLLQSLLDPATTAPGGRALAEQLGGKLIMVDGGDHGAFRRGNTTVDQAVLKYLTTGQVDITTAPETPITPVNYLASVRKLLTDNGIVAPTVVGPTIPDTPFNRLLSRLGPNVDTNSIVPKPTFAAPSTPAPSQTSTATKEPAPALAASTALTSALPTAASTPDTTTAPAAVAAPATAPATSNPKPDRPTVTATETGSPTPGTATTGTPSTSTADTAPSTTDKATTTDSAPAEKTTEKSATTSEPTEKASTADSGSTTSK
ncbi:alpha/beta hydrolase [Tsukamurella strandjordii]|uniref:alpha/beta hydrolase n=1 Tax=Tsukamurella TaxID=2060 RepID=UPI001C7CA63E|nr:alpha/beta hydrolase [Tsukamurella sp. TY48]GIZ98086.1 hypothetical protein TTY48_26980 [Tsukamurella sp. TY48]